VYEPLQRTLSSNYSLVGHESTLNDKISKMASLTNQLLVLLTQIL
jgi:hypothetical protein